MIIGNTTLQNAPKEARGAFVEIRGEKYYRIENYDSMQPFFISLASDVDLWMYISSTGGLTCGRKSPDTALFPYYTDDKITENSVHTGPCTAFRVHKEGNVYLWEPFSDRYAGMYEVRRNILKSVVGNKLIFEEINETLGIGFSYMWTSADHYGWIRKVCVENLSSAAVELEVMDGLQNVLPAGTDRVTQNTYSTLVDGYKKTEQAEDSSLLLFRMEAIMVDRAEPSESLRCNTIYTLGLSNAVYMTSNRQLNAFRRGETIVAEPEAKGVRGAAMVYSKVALMCNAHKEWYFVADVEKDACDVRRLMSELKNGESIAALEAAVKHSTDTLKEIVALNDGIQETADEHVNARHFANVLFNTMRGGFYVDNYSIGGSAFAAHVRLFNIATAAQHAAFLGSLPEKVAYEELGKMVREQGDPQLERLYLEYLPLTFSRRHGDPSRPWNLFSIRVNDKDGERLISYQGNWRDIFQNWEALSLSYPGFVNGIISKFFNATTIDGYNPYKVTSEGIDWELINPADPWSNIGYWGDHQIIYLLKLLELSNNHNPEALRSMMERKIFAFANVPYRLKTYDEIVADPKNSIVFDAPLHEQIMGKLPEVGQDAKLILKNGQPLLVSFTDKLLITFLTKMSNFIPDAGIWMNTLRPEWNDANNALVGYGASMVTLCYMRRFASFARDLYERSEVQTYEVCAEVAQFITAVSGVMHTHEGALTGGFTARTRRSFTDGMGHAGETYRKAVYNGSSAEKSELSREEIVACFSNALRFIDASIRANKRDDGLYNAYNLVEFSEDSISVTYLYQMLEGQVAILTSGILDLQETVELLKTMRASDLYRADQNSYMLYPARKRASFLKKNNIPDEVKTWPETAHLLAEGIFTQDQDGGLHFNAGFNNAEFLKKAGAGLTEQELKKALDLYEQVFNHRAFTGRSGTFYKYEGLGCIYWHMVSKLLLAVGENIARYASSDDFETLEELKHIYKDVQNGIGAHKSPAVYGSFPFDPYSHTPSMAGVQQPGMTGQVKEDIINRFFELGIRIENGSIRIDETMIDPREFVDGELHFTYCSVPFVYTIGKAEKGIVVDSAYLSATMTDETIIHSEISKHIFARDGVIQKITVNF